MTTSHDRSHLLASLEEGIARLTTSDSWRDHLAFQSRFHRYSYGNVLLIAAQDREATQVAGFRSWQRLNRTVRKGEKAIWILAPMVGRRPGSSSDGDERVIRGFRYVPVFDIAQTHGDDPPLVCTRLEGGDPDGLYPRLVEVARSIDFTIVNHEFTDTTNGDCSSSARRIRIETRNSPAQRVKTLAHELGHALLHESVEDRALAELEAESTAYVVCRGLGLDTGGYSFGYVATWAGGGTQAIATIKSCCDRIQKTATFILRSLEEAPEAA
jgi:antirestriction protein ArdC